MDLKELKGKGGFVPSALVKKSVQWEHNGETLDFDIFVRRLSFGVIEKMLANNDNEQSRTSMLIAACICLGDGGKESLSYDDAYQLEPTLARVFADALKEVNELGK